MTRLMIKWRPHCGILECFAENWFHPLVPKCVKILKNVDVVDPPYTSYWYRYLQAFWICFKQPALYSYHRLAFGNMKSRWQFAYIVIYLQFMPLYKILPFLCTIKPGKSDREWVECLLEQCVMDCLTIVFFSICYRSMHKLAQLERLDLGNNEFSELVSKCIF